GGRPSAADARPARTRGRGAPRTGRDGTAADPAGDRQRPGDLRPAPHAVADERGAGARCGGFARRRPRPRPRGGDRGRVALEPNGREGELECRSDEMLLDVLRRETGVRSVRETCRIGVCGACTVLLDDAPVSGCLMLTAQAAGRRVTTVE